jgi:hypothetical protein
VAGIGVEQFLQLADALAELGGLDAGGFLLQPVAVGGIKIFEADVGNDFDGLLHRGQIQPRMDADEHGIFSGARRSRRFNRRTKAYAQMNLMFGRSRYVEAG